MHDTPAIAYSQLTLHRLTTGRERAILRLVDATALPARPSRSLHRFANPGRFLRLAARVQPWVTWPALVLTVAGLVWGLFFSPADWQQGDSVRIMYIHVPAAWLASAGYFGLALCSLSSLVWRHPLADLGGGRDRAGGRRVHRAVPGHRQPVGQADVGHLVGVGRAADQRAGAVLPVSRPYRADPRLRRPGARRPGGGDPGAGRGDQPADHQVQRRLVEHAASAGDHHADRGAGHACGHAVAAAGVHARLHADVSSRWCWPAPAPR